MIELNCYIFVKLMVTIVISLSDSHADFIELSTQKWNLV